MSDALTVVGTVGSEPEARATPTGRNVTSFRLASTRRIHDPQTGEWRDGDTNWYTVSAWNDLGRNVHDSIRKGERVLVAGRLKVRKWENEERHGMEAELVAGSVGHDLKWGTTRYTKAARSGENRPNDALGSSSNADLEEDLSAGAPEAGTDDWEVVPQGDIDAPF